MLNDGCTSDSAGSLPRFRPSTTVGGRDHLVPFRAGDSTSDSMTITFTGRGAHGSMPNQSI